MKITDKLRVCAVYYEPTPEQIKKFIKSVHDMAIMVAVHYGQEPPDPDLIAVMSWLEGLCADLHSPQKKDIPDGDDA